MNFVGVIKLNDAPSLFRSPLAPPLRSGYRERDRDLREKERSGSRDQDEHYGRPGYDRPPYERSGPERYGHSASPYGMTGVTSLKTCKILLQAILGGILLTDLMPLSSLEVFTP